MTRAPRERREPEPERRDIVRKREAEPACVAGLVASANAGWLQWLAGLRS